MKNKIYTMWWQGFDNAPDIIKICHNSLLRHYNPETQEVISLDFGNYRQYVKLPMYIFDKVDSGAISLTHFSDLIRSYLLKETGGLWVDASMLFTRDIKDDVFFEPDFFTMKNPSARDDDITSKWECFFIAGKKDFPLFKLLVDFWLEYWKKENELIAYLLTEHIFYIGYINSRRIKTAIDLCKPFYYKIDYFQKIINAPYCKEKFQEIIANEPYIKLSYKYSLHSHTKDNKLTYYGYLREEFM